MADKDPADKPAQAAQPPAKPASKNPKDAHPMSKLQAHRPGGHGFNPNNFSPKPIRNRNMGRSR